MNQETEFLYTPSNWSSRRNLGMSNSDIVEEYCAVSKSGGDEVVKSMIKRVILPVSCDGLEKDEEVFVFAPSDESKHQNCLFAFIHGGYWVDGSSRDLSLFIAPTLSQNGIHYAAISYRDYNGQSSLSLKVKTVVHAVNRISSYASEKGIRHVIVGGHSAGGHLAASILCHPDLTPVAHRLIKGLFLMSGLYDLVPLLQTSMLLDYPHLQVADRKAAEALSPSYHLSSDKPLSLTSMKYVGLYVGGEESSGFHQQSIGMEKLLRLRGISTDYQTIPNLDHFVFLTSLGNPKSVVSKLLIDFCLKVSTE